MYKEVKKMTKITSVSWCLIKEVGYTDRNTEVAMSFIFGSVFKCKASTMNIHSILCMER